MKKYTLIVIVLIVILVMGYLAPYLIWMLKGAPESEPATLNTDKLTPMRIVNEYPQASYRFEVVDYDMYLDLSDAVRRETLTDETFSSLFWDIETLAWSRSGWQRSTISYYASFSGLDRKEWLAVYKDDGSGKASPDNIMLVLKARSVTEVPEVIKAIKLL